MLDELKEMGVETFSVQPELCFSQDKLLVAIAITLVTILALLFIVCCVIKAIGYFSDYSPTVVRIGGWILIFIVMAFLVCLSYFLESPPKAETGRVLYEIYVDDIEKYAEISDKYEVVDHSKYPIVTIAVSPDDWLGLNQGLPDCWTYRNKIDFHER